MTRSELLQRKWNMRVNEGKRWARNRTLEMVYVIFWTIINYELHQRLTLTWRHFLCLHFSSIYMTNVSYANVCLCGSKDFKFKCVTFVDQIGNSIVNESRAACVRNILRLIFKPWIVYDVIFGNNQLQGKYHRKYHVQVLSWRSRHVGFKIELICDVNSTNDDDGGYIQRKT